MKGWIKEHSEVLIIVGALLGATWTIKSDISDVRKDLTKEIQEVDKRLTTAINELDKRLTSVEMILIMQGFPLKTVARSEPKETLTQK